jgi:GEVED domain
MFRFLRLAQSRSRRSRRVNHKAKGPAPRRLTVEWLEDRRLLVVFPVFSTSDSSAANSGSLRRAIMDSNASTNLPNNNEIHFFLGSGVHTIQPGSPLPDITRSVVIDGYAGVTGASQNTLVDGDNAVLLIALDGTNAGAGTSGLHITAGGSTVRGLMIDHFSNGIWLETNGFNHIEGNFIGTNGGNSLSGVRVDNSSSNFVGGTTLAARNVISGNTGVGVTIAGAGATGNFVLRNTIGLDPSGLLALSNGNGVVIDSAPGNYIGVASFGNLISGNSQNGVLIQGLGSSANVVQGNLIGTDRTGMADLGNTGDGLYIASPSNIIGGATPGQGNVISGNNANGVTISGPDATLNKVQGNFIGTDVTGAFDCGNAYYGVEIDFGSINNTIGGATAGLGNVISGNDDNGVVIYATGTQVQGNFIGTDATGMQVLGNSRSGVRINASGTTIGGPSSVVGGKLTGAGNVISANLADGITLSTPFMLPDTGNLVQGNFIGTDVTGSIDLGNAGEGVSVNFESDNNTIGGNTAGLGNVISGNGSRGILIALANGTVVQGNWIGTNQGGANLGNDLTGVLINGSNNNLIGGPQPAASNTIANNGYGGVSVPFGTGNRITANSIYNNVLLGINLGDADVTANDAGDADTGPNDLQNFPVLDYVSVTGNSIVPFVTRQVHGSLDSTPNTSFIIEFFGIAGDPSGHGEGAVFLGSTTVVTGPTGTVNFVYNGLSSLLGVGLSATATNLSTNNTSEFSQNVSLTDFGDAPAPYPTLLADSGARHSLSNLFLGGSIDGEPNGQPNATATGDDLTGLQNDDDGVVFNTSPLVPGDLASVSVTVTLAGFAPIGNVGILDAWLDFNGDGDWADPGEHIFVSQPLSVGNHALSFPVPAGAKSGTTYARFRLSNQVGLSFDTSSGAPIGEVEDYAVTIAPTLGFTPLSGGNYTLRRNGANLEIAYDSNPTVVVASRPFADTNNVVITGAAGVTDILTVDFGGALFPFSGPIDFNAGAGGDDKLKLLGTGFTSVDGSGTGPGAGFYNIDGFIINYTGLSTNTIIDELGAVNRKFTLPNTNDQARLGDDASGIPGMSTLESLSGTFETVHFRNPTGSLTVQLGGGDDTLVLQTLDPSFPPTVPVTIDGGGQSDTLLLDYTLGNPIPPGGLTETRVVVVDRPLSPVDTLDDGEPGYTDKGAGWQSQTAGWMGDARVHEAGTGSAAATWLLHPRPLRTAYELFATWVADPANATDAAYTISDGGRVLATVHRNQQATPSDATFDGRVWQSLGTYQINTGVVKIELSTSGGGRVVADGVLAVSVEAPSDRRHHDDGPDRHQPVDDARDAFFYRMQEDELLNLLAGDQTAPRKLRR